MLLCLSFFFNFIVWFSERMKVFGDIYSMWKKLELVKGLTEDAEFMHYKLFHNLKFIICSPSYNLMS